MRRSLVPTLVLALAALLAGCLSGSDDSSDAGRFDAGATDAGPADSGPTDAGPVDGGSGDAGPGDGGSTDAGPVDGGSGDAGPGDGGPTDAGPTDGGPIDGGGLCPTASATTGIRGTDIVAEPLETITLDGSASTTAPGRTIVSYQWSVVSSPADFVPEWTDNTALTDLRLGVPGVYRIRLDVFDDQGTASCTPAFVSIDARTNQDLYIALTWITPSDPDPTTAPGTDLDLHLKEPGGTWNDSASGTDVFYANRTADWGVAGTADDATLVVDDIAGLGPEAIVIPSPAATSGSPYSSPYDVGVYFYNAWGYAPVTARLRIWEYGALVFDLSTTLANDGPSQGGSGDFWHVCAIDWDPAGNAFTPIDLVTPGAP